MYLFTCSMCLQLMTFGNLLSVCYMNTSHIVLDVEWNFFLWPGVAAYVVMTWR